MLAAMVAATLLWSMAGVVSRQLDSATASYWNSLGMVLGAAAML